MSDEEVRVQLQNMLRMDGWQQSTTGGWIAPAARIGTATLSLEEALDYIGWSWWGEPDMPAARDQ